MRNVSKLILALLTLAWLAALLPARDARAGVFKCASHKMTLQDAGKLKVSAQRARANHELIWSTMSPCMNPGRGRVWIEAQDEPQPDGSVLHPHALCTRQTGEWKCEFESGRTLVTTLDLAGRSQSIKAVIPMDFDAADVGKLVAQAFEIAPTLTMRESCGAKQDDKVDPRDAIQIEGVRSAFRATGAPKSVEIYSLDSEKDSIEVEIDGNALQFGLSPSASGLREFRCWDIVIVVT